MNRLYDALFPEILVDDDLMTHYSQLKALIPSSKNLDKIMKGVIRHAFLIEPVKLPKVETTKIRVRWYEDTDPGLVGSRYDSDDPRYCTFDDCLTIFRDLLRVLTERQLEDPGHREMVQVCLDYNRVSYELPIDYVQRAVQFRGRRRIHCPDNVVWSSDEGFLVNLRFRRDLLSSDGNPELSLFKRIYGKVKVKCYLTDRALTGPTKTNREKRWEAHPDSVQFAFRRDCLAIEARLMRQIADFGGFPSTLRHTLAQRGLVDPKTDDFVCPVTLEPVSFSEFRESIMLPQHGRSEFQVGHLNPLKLDQIAQDAAVGHTPDNVSWISADGNRIQGSMSLADIRTLLGKIAQNYATAGLIEEAAITPEVQTHDANPSMS